MVQTRGSSRRPAPASAPPGEENASSAAALTGGGDKRRAQKRRPTATPAAANKKKKNVAKLEVSDFQPATDAATTPVKPPRDASPVGSNSSVKKEGAVLVGSAGAPVKKEGAALTGPCQTPFEATGQLYLGAHVSGAGELCAREPLVGWTQG